MRPLQAAEALRDACDDPAIARLAPYVYNPLRYAWAPHAEYARRYGEKGGRVALLVGMNPGPHGMGQTGVPFGEVSIVRDWMGISGTVAQPAKPHPKRPVAGFATRRREPSGARLYGWARERYGSADAFFSRFFVVNYVPLMFFDDAGRNLTPPQLPKGKTRALYEACDAHLAAVAEALQPEFLVGVGAFAEARVRMVAEARGLGAKIGSVLHPSPASPAANRGWAPQAEAQLRALGVPLE